MKQTGIIGGGASGMMAAIAAARGGARVTILEKRDRVGKKILATGNGKCNLSNRDFLPARDYRSHAPERLEAFFGQFGVPETVRFFTQQGMLLTERDGYLYPRSAQAATVLDFLREQLVCLGVSVVCSVQVKEISRTNRGYRVHTSQGTYSFDTLILACGSAAGCNPKDALGGFLLAESLGLTVIPPVPALTALRCRETCFKAMAGVRCPASVTLHIEGSRQTFCDTGELQLTDYGISGIPVFQVSRYAAEALSLGRHVRAVLNFMPEIADRDWEAFCLRQYRTCLGMPAERFANGMLHKKVAGVLLSLCSIRPAECLTEPLSPRFRSFFEKMRSFEAEIIGTNPMEQAQVCAGGVSLQDVTDRLEAKAHPGLYLCGEMLDVDGRCGGYNLQWAWTSGQIAGCAAAQESDANQIKRTYKL